MNIETKDLTVEKGNSLAAFVLKNVQQVRENQLILDDINLEIAENALTAIAGPSGAGNTSLLRLLNRFTTLQFGQAGDLPTESASGSQ